MNNEYYGEWVDDMLNNKDPKQVAVALYEETEFVDEVTRIGLTYWCEGVGYHVYSESELKDVEVEYDGKKYYVMRVD